MQFEKNTFNKRIKSMLKVDFKRMLTTPLFYLSHYKSMEQVPQVC